MPSLFSALCLLLFLFHQGLVTLRFVQHNRQWYRSNILGARVFFHHLLGGKFTFMCSLISVYMVDAHLSVIYYALLYIYTTFLLFNKFRCFNCSTSATFYQIWNLENRLSFVLSVSIQPNYNLINKITFFFYTN